MFCTDVQCNEQLATILLRSEEWDGEGCQYSLFMQNNSPAGNQHVKRVRINNYAVMNYCCQEITKSEEAKQCRQLCH